MSARIADLGLLGIAAAELDPDRRVIAANAALCKILDASSDSLKGSDLATTLGAAAAGTSGEGPFAAYRIMRGNSVSWYRLDLRDDGRIAILVDVSRELTRLDDIKNFYATRDRLLLDGVIGTWRYDPDAELYYFSNELTRDYEDATESVPPPILELIQHPDDRTKDAAIREKIVHEGGFANAEIRYAKTGGGWTHLNVHYRAGRRMPSGRYEMLGVSQNITAVALARDEARQASQRLTLALRAAQAGVFEYDYVKNSFWLSPELIELLGEERLKLVGRGWLTLFHAGDQDVARQFVDGAMVAAHATSLELRLLHPGGYRWVKLYFDVKNRDAEGKPLLGVGLLIDIDEKKRQEIALAEAQRAADFANRSKTEFLANMSHELRTPLNAILGFSEMIARKMSGPVAEKYVGYARDIHKSGEHLLDLINDVLDLSKLEAGKLELHESDIALDAIVEDCLVLVRTRADEGSVRLHADCERGLPALRADARAVRQVLLNFLSNAVKFTPEGGAVTVRTWCGADGTISLSVSDTGIGMKPADVAVALAPFGQIDSHLARKHVGSGLGLPICKSLMELHGGNLVLASVVDEGTTLTANFPANRAVRAAMTG